MKWIKSFAEITGKLVDMPGAKDVSMKILVGPDQGAPNFVMRHFSIEPGGNSPRHTHPYEHEIFFLSGEGELFLEGEYFKAESGTVAYIPPDDDHQIKNVGRQPLTFLCLVPKDI